MTMLVLGYLLCLLQVFSCQIPYLISYLISYFKFLYANNIKQCYI
jgi:hypothetical protein